MRPRMPNCAARPLLSSMLGVEGVPAEVKGSVTKVTDTFISGSFDALHDGKLKEANEGKYLEGSGSQGGQGRRYRWGRTRMRDRTDMSVLDLDVTETLLGRSEGDDERLHDADMFRL
jgi:hypothetical protein